MSGSNLLDLRMHVKRDWGLAERCLKKVQGYFFDVDGGWNGERRRLSIHLRLRKTLSKLGLFA